jgi:Recombination endonuclease VII
MQTKFPSSILPKCQQKRAEAKTCHHFAFCGIGCQEYAEIVARANGHCELCGIAEADTQQRRIVIDHDHREDWMVRGMVCDKCNSLMSKVDGKKAWGPDRSLEAEALRYVANSWHLTRGERYPHPVPMEITADVRHGFISGAPTARIHLLAGPWSNEENSINRGICGWRVCLPADPAAVGQYVLCLRCDGTA